MKRTMYQAARHTPKRKVGSSNLPGGAKGAKTDGFGSFLHLLKWTLGLELHSSTVNFLLTKFLLLSIEIACQPTLANI